MTGNTARHTTANSMSIFFRTNTEHNTNVNTTLTQSLIYVTANKLKNLSYMRRVVLCQLILSASAILPIVNFDLKKVLGDMSIERSVVFYLCGGYVVCKIVVWC